HGVKSIDVLIGSNAAQHRLRIHVLGQRHLNQNAVHRGIGIESVDDVDQLLLRDVRGTPNGLAVHAKLVRRPFLAADVYRARRILADKDDRQARRYAARLERLHADGNLGLHLRGDLRAIEQLVTRRDELGWYHAWASGQSPPPASRESAPP